MRNIYIYVSIIKFLENVKGLECYKDKHKCYEIFLNQKEDIYLATRKVIVNSEIYQGIQLNACHNYFPRMILTDKFNIFKCPFLFFFDVENIYIL